jgi:hypothetical protein
LLKLIYMKNEIFWQFFIKFSNINFMKICSDILKLLHVYRWMGGLSNLLGALQGYKHAWKVTSWAPGYYANTRPPRWPFISAATAGIEPGTFWILVC